MHNVDKFIKYINANLCEITYCIVEKAPVIVEDVMFLIFKRDKYTFKLAIEIKSFNSTPEQGATLLYALVYNKEGLVSLDKKHVKMSKVKSIYRKVINQELKLVDDALSKKTHNEKVTDIE